MWTREIEIDFLNKTKELISLEKLLISVRNRHYVFAPKSIGDPITTPQARNAYIGSYTEKWCKDFFAPLAEELRLYAINGVICNELGLTSSSPADLAFCRKNSIEQKAEDIVLLFEIKMSIVNNYTFKSESNTFTFIGDYTTHKGTPSLLRSDSMLKAIGKSLNIRMASSSGKKIPILIIGNSPISNSYIKKVDHLKQGGVIQQFISLYPHPTNRTYTLETPIKGFKTYNDQKDIFLFIKSILKEEKVFFSSMVSERELGKIISICSKEKTDKDKGLKFLELINEQY